MTPTDRDALERAVELCRAENAASRRRIPAGQGSELDQSRRELRVPLPEALHCLPWQSPPIFAHITEPRSDEHRRAVAPPGLNVTVASSECGVNADTGNLIARKDAYIPINMNLDHKAANATVAEWKRLAEQRREIDKRYSDEMARLFMPYSVRFATR